MIGKLRGQLLEKNPPALLLEVNGVGYEVDAPMSTFYQLPEIGNTIALWTHLSIREDAHQLFGFYSEEERRLFRSLLKVNGIGPRLALAVLSSVEPHVCVEAILSNDTAQLVRVPGIGKKTAERMVIEMRDRLSDWRVETMSSMPSPRQRVLEDAIAALVSLGYKNSEAHRVVTQLDEGQFTSEELIRLALRERMA